MSDEIIREVDEEVKRDRLQAQLKRYGPLIAAAVIVVVVGAAGGSWWVGIQDERQMQYSEDFSEAAAMAREGNLEDALEAFGILADSGDAGYRVLAGLREAALLVEVGDTCHRVI